MHKLPSFWFSFYPGIFFVSLTGKQLWTWCGRWRTVRKRNEISLKLVWRSEVDDSWQPIGFGSVREVGRMKMKAYFLSRMWEWDIPSPRTWPCMGFLPLALFDFFHGDPISGEVKKSVIPLWCILSDLQYRVTDCLYIAAFLYILYMGLHRRHLGKTKEQYNRETVITSFSVHAYSFNIMLHSQFHQGHGFTICIVKVRK